MYKTLFPSKDTTLYSRHIKRNTGADQILEITKITSGSAIEDVLGSYTYWDTNHNSRILMDFDVSSISSSIADGSISNVKFYLSMKATEAIHLPIAYTLYAYPISASWTNGTGYHNNDAEVRNGASWQYKDGESSAVEWTTAGGDFYTQSAYEASQAFNYEEPDVRMDVSNIINAWISGSIPQNGIMIKHLTATEDDTSVMGSLKFFSKDTHTIYLPRLEAYWDDVDVSGTGSVTQISGEDYVVYTKNVREAYYENETPKIRIGVRDRFPNRSYTTSNANTTLKRLPYDSFYQVMDSVTDEVIIPFNDVGTRLSCDVSGSYFRLDMNSFMPLRYYKMIFKVETDSGDTINYIDDGYYFKVKRK